MRNWLHECWESMKLTMAQPIGWTGLRKQYPADETEEHAEKPPRQLGKGGFRLGGRRARRHDKQYPGD